MSTEPTTYPGYRFPAEVIHHATWLYHVFSLSLRDLELILAERGVVVSHESIRRWCLRFGADMTLLHGYARNRAKSDTCRKWRYLNFAAFSAT